MSTAARRVLFWAPRILTILFAAFTALFALDVFTEAHGFWPTVAALLMHLVPTFVVVIVLVFAWRWELVGTVAYFALAAFFVARTWGHGYLTTYLLFCGPLLVAGALFLAGWLLKRRPR